MAPRLPAGESNRRKSFSAHVRRCERGAPLKSCGDRSRLEGEACGDRARKRIIYEDCWSLPRKPNLLPSLGLAGEQL